MLLYLQVSSALPNMKWTNFSLLNFCSVILICSVSQGEAGGTSLLTRSHSHLLLCFTGKVYLSFVYSLESEYKSE